LKIYALVMIDREHFVKKSGVNGMAMEGCVANIRCHGICNLRYRRHGRGHWAEPGGIYVVSDAGEA
jgi:hypothetical protein